MKNLSPRVFRQRLVIECIVKYPITAVEIANVMGEANIVLTVDEKDRGIAIGKEGERIKAAKEFLKKKYPMN